MADVLGFRVKDIDGREVDLNDYRGKVVLFVNLASKCGFTPQYTALESLWQAYRDRGFAILGFPSNDFGGQEPGAEDEIKTFCAINYGVTFPLFSKVTVKGPARAPVYEALSEAAGEPKWNFHKYLVSRDGRVLKAFPSNVGPTDHELTSAVEAALG